MSCVVNLCYFRPREFAYKYFFLITHEASRCFFFIELAKFFDNDKRGQSLTIKTIMEYAQKNIKSFSTKEFKIYHKERSILPELFKTYKPLMLSDIKKIERRLIRNEKIIKDLKTYRDEYLAHDDLEKTEVHINAREIKILFKIIRDTIELLYHKLEFGSNAYENYDKEPVADINRVVKDLHEHEKERIRKIKEKYNY